jgi:glycosyltransferase involved in cell wall biosynthesis
LEHYRVQDGKRGIFCYGKKRMRLLISTGIYPPEVGGPALYAKNLFDEYSKRGNEVVVVSFGRERKLPWGIRHAFFLAKILWRVWRAEAIIVLDTASVGVATALAARLFGRKMALRIGGDFLWEWYVDRTHEKIPLDEFYADPGRKKTFTAKEKLIFRFTNFVLKAAYARAFTTEWQMKIWQKAYSMPSERNIVIGNFIGNSQDSEQPERKEFLWAGREIFLKNVAVLKEGFEAARAVRRDIFLDCIHVPHEELQRRLVRTYAVVVPSLSEVSPNLILDALGHRKPFIVTKHNGIAELLGDTAVLVDPLRAEDIKEKILWLADDVHYAQQLEKIRGFSARHSWEQIADEFLAIFKSDE